MNCKLSKEATAQVFRRLAEKYEIYAPKCFAGEGRFSETDLIKYDIVNSWDEIVFDKKSDFPAKEVLTPINRTILYFTEDEYRESKASTRPILLFMRPCDINAMEHQEKIYLENGGQPDVYYARMRDRVRIVMMECTEGWDTCFCVSMGTNKTDRYSIAVRNTADGALFDVKDDEFASCFDGMPAADFKPEFVKKNQISVTPPEIKDDEELLKLKNHSFWKQFNGRCISCGACTVACSTCTCFSTRDIIYGQNPKVGERRRVESSCQVAGFDVMAGGMEFRKDAGSRMRYKVLHKFHDYKTRFGVNMCVGCGRCIDRCPEFISIVKTVELMNDALDEIRAEKTEIK